MTLDDVAQRERIFLDANVIVYFFGSEPVLGPMSRTFFHPHSTTRN